MPNIEENGMTLNYEISGSGKTTLLLVHGSFIDQRYWKEQVAYFKNGYQVITLDLPGHGKSGRKRKNWTISAFADDLIFLIKKLNLSNVILIGHSIAGDISLLTAIKHPTPVIGLIGIDTFKNAGKPMATELKQQIDGIKKGLSIDFAGTSEQYARMALLSPSTPEAIVKRVISAYRNAYSPMGTQTTIELFDINEIEKEQLPQLTLKLYLINVDYQPTNEAALKQFIGQNYQLTILKGTSHFPMLEHPAELNAALLQDIEAIESGT